MPVKPTVIVALAFGVAVLGGCSKAEPAPVRPAQAMLDLAQVRSAQTTGLIAPSDLSAQPSAQDCTAIRQSLDQIGKASSGAFRYAGNGALVVQRQLWAQAPAEMRAGLAEAAALAAGCEGKRSPQTVEITVRDAGGEVLARGPLSTFGH